MCRGVNKESPSTPARAEGLNSESQLSPVLSTVDERDRTGKQTVPLGLMPTSEEVSEAAVIEVDKQGLCAESSLRSNPWSAQFPGVNSRKSSPPSEPRFPQA